MKRMTVLAAALASGALVALSTGVQAAPAVVATAPHTIVVQTAPPAPIAEPIPSPREGWAWSPGHYEWRDGSYAWVPGHWMRDRPGWEWEEARWIQRADGSWQLTGGYWVRDDDDRRHSHRFGPNGDLDGDGIRNADDRDRDGDGVANRDDDFPSNPRRS